MMDRRSRSHPPQCTTSCEDRTTDVSYANGAMKEGCGWQNGMKLSLLTSHASVCNTTMGGFESGDTVEKMLNSCVMHRHTGPTHRVLGHFFLKNYQSSPTRSSIAEIIVPAKPGFRPYSESYKGLQNYSLWAIPP
ncbi:uncharacterized protein TNCV_1623761 [Trichonephila clavipes]|nr:uncharacterized protein TNCV_1623761 [Trichonephila clavipes]